MTTKLIFCTALAAVVLVSGCTDIRYAVHPPGVPLDDLVGLIEKGSRLGDSIAATQTVDGVTVTCGGLVGLGFGRPGIWLRGFGFIIQNDSGGPLAISGFPRVYVDGKEGVMETYEYVERKLARSHGGSSLTGRDSIRGRPSDPYASSYQRSTTGDESSVEIAASAKFQAERDWQAYREVRRGANFQYPDLVEYYWRDEKLETGHSIFRDVWMNFDEFSRHIQADQKIVVTANVGGRQYSFEFSQTQLP